MDSPVMFRWKNPNEPANVPGLMVRFEVISQRNEKATGENGGIPTFDSVLMAYVAPIGMPRSDAACEIRRTLPDGSVIHNRLNSAKYAEVIKQYDAGADAIHLGTPLKEMPGLDPGMISNLKARGIHTVEMLAEAPDSANGDLMGLMGWVEKAKNYVALVAKEAPAKHLKAELEKRDAAYASLERQFEDLKAAIVAGGGQLPAPRGKPGRKSRADLVAMADAEQKAA